jgi:hypothetical protein
VGKGQLPLLSCSKIACVLALLNAVGLLHPQKAERVKSTLQDGHKMACQGCKWPQGSIHRKRALWRLVRSSILVDPPHRRRPRSTVEHAIISNKEGPIVATYDGDAKC